MSQDDAQDTDYLTSKWVSGGPLVRRGKSEQIIKKYVATSTCPLMMDGASALVLLQSCWEILLSALFYYVNYPSVCP